MQSLVVSEYSKYRLFQWTLCFVCKSINYQNNTACQWRLQIWQYMVSDPIRLGAMMNMYIYTCIYMHCIYDSFSDVGENRVYFASKNLTPCRMHWNAFLIAQIIAKCHSFPNMYDMLQAKVDRLAGKTYFVQKKHLKTAFFGGKEFGLPDFGRSCMPNYWA